LGSPRENRQGAFATTRALYRVCHNEGGGGKWGQARRKKSLDPTRKPPRCRGTRGAPRGTKKGGKGKKWGGRQKTEKKIEKKKKIEAQHSTPGRRYSPAPVSAY